MEKLKMSETNPIDLVPVENPPSNFIFGRILSQEKEEFCEVMTGHTSPEKTIIHSLAFEVGMIFNSQYGNNEVLEIVETRKSKFKDKRLQYWSSIKTKAV